MILKDEEIKNNQPVNDFDDEKQEAYKAGLEIGSYWARNETARRTLKQYQQQLNEIKGVSRVKKIELLDTLKEILGINYETI